MKGVALRTNKVTFATGEIEDDEGFYGFCSRAGRFKLLQDRVTSARCQLLFVVADCVTQTVIDEIIQKFGNDGRYIIEGLRAVQYGLQESMFNAANILGAWYINDGGLPIAQRNALHHILSLCSSHPDFQRISQRTFDRDLNDSRYPGWETLFRPDALSSILQWQPVPWAILSASELQCLESFVVFADDDMKLGVPDLLSYEALGFKFFFSACAIAINYLNCHPAECLQMRNIVAKEDFKSVSNPECHARGLIRFCEENPKLHIERHVGLWDRLFPPCWHDIHVFTKLPTWAPTVPRPGGPPACDLLPPLVDWFMEASFLDALMPSPSFRFIFDGSSSYTFKAWNLVVRASSLQEGMLEQQRQLNLDSPQASEHVDFERNSYPLPCHLTAGFSDVIKSIQQANSPVIDFRGYVGGTWDVADILATRMMWSQEQWHSEWSVLMKE